jgi:phage-related minor tail protein
MEIGTLVVGIIIGLIVGGTAGSLVVYAIMKSAANASDQKVNHTEQELKALLAIQARQHLDTSRSALADIQQKTDELAKQLLDYEESLTQATSSADESKDTFFGEHASLFLRNNLKNNKQNIALAQPDAQPRDFANSGSGVFVGGVANDPVSQEENKSQS